MNKRLLLVLAGILVAVVLLGACSPSKPTEGIAPTETKHGATVTPESIETQQNAGKVVLRVGGLEDVDCWNPFSCNGIWQYGRLMFEGFFEPGPNPDCNGVPVLADSYEVSPDGLTYTLHLHKGITFSDGTIFNAYTAAEYIDWIRNNEELKYMQAETIYMTSVTALDDLTLSFTTSRPISTFVDYGSHWFFMFPPAYWKALPAENIYTDPYMPPIGTGPYVLTKWVPGQYIIYDARPDYYRGKPPIDRIIYQIYTSSDALLLAFLSGEIDMTTRDMPPESYDQLKSAPNVVVEEKPSGSFYRVVFNMAENGKKNPVIMDPAVREAIDYAIDKQRILDVALLGHGELCPNNWICGKAFNLDPSLQVTPFDLAKARQILDKAGYLDKDNDGIRETTDGKPIELRLYFDMAVSPSTTMVPMISDWLKEIGIATKVEGQESSTFMQTILGDRDFDLAILNKEADVDFVGIEFDHTCWSADQGISALNYPGYCNPELDKLLEDYRFATDAQVKQATYLKAQELINKDRAEIILAGENSIQAYNSAKFEFPLNSCFVGRGMWWPWSLMQAKVK